MLQFFPSLSLAPGPGALDNNTFPQPVPHKSCTADPAGPPIFASEAAIPPMPWKASPKAGHLKGVIRDGGASSPLDGATITVSGGVNRTTMADATGFYGFVSLPPGNYKVTASFPGCQPVFTDVVITTNVATCDLTIPGAPAIASHPDGLKEKEVRLEDITDIPVSFHSEMGESGEFTWWLPAGAAAYILPISAGVVVDASRSDLMRWLRDGSPWSLLDLPALGVRYSNQMMVVIVPWPNYAELIVKDRIGIQFSFPKGRHQVAPCDIVAMRRGADPLEVARGFREWRLNATNTGVIPRPRPLEKKMADLEKAKRLLGAPHFYLWGPALFSRHDIPRNKWAPFAKALRGAPPRASAASW